MSILGSLIGGAFSLFGASKARKQAKEDAANKFIDLRAAALAGGFNPLTALESTGGAGFGAYPSSAPPLASIELLTGAADGVVDELSGAADLRRKTDQLNYDLAALKLDQARSGVVLPAPPSAVSAFGPSSLGAAPVEVVAHGTPPMDEFNLYVRVYDPMTGRWVTIPNPDLTESGPTEVATGLATIGAADALQNGGKAVLSFGNSVGSSYRFPSVGLGARYAPRFPSAPSGAGSSPLPSDWWKHQVPSN